MRKSIRTKLLSVVLLLSLFSVLANVTNLNSIKTVYQTAYDSLDSQDSSTIEAAKEELVQIYEYSVMSNYTGIGLMLLLTIVAITIATKSIITPTKKSTKQLEGILQDFGSNQGDLSK